MIKKIVYISILSLLFSSCIEKEESPIPDSEVYLKLGWNDYTKLSNPATARAFTAENNVYPTNTKLGYGGILVFRDLEGNIRACDLACPYERQRSVKVEIVETLTAKCPNCNSYYDLTFGMATPKKGPSKHQLKIYDHVIDNGTTIIVSN